MRPIGGQAAAQAAQAAEQTRAVEAYQETYNILALDAQRTYEAQQRAALEDLRRETKRSGDRVKQLKDTALLLSAENLSKAELVDAMGARLAELSAELSTLSVMQARDSAASGLKTRTEDDKAAMLQTVFESTLEHAVSKRIAEGSAIAPTYQHQQVGPRRTAVYFCPEGEDRRNAVSSAVFVLARTTSFRELTANACRYFGVDPETCMLEDENGTLWPLDVMASREIARYRGDQTVRLVRRTDMSALQLHEAELDQADDAAHEEANVGALMQMLRRDGEAQADGAGGPPVGGGDREGGGGGGGAEDEEAAERAAAMEALAALDDEETDSDDDEKGRKEYVEPPIKFMREIRELILHLIFLGLLVWSTSVKRTITDANALYNALQTIFVEEEFGDFNEKAYLDVRNFEEVWDWTKGPLMGGLFESDVDDTGNIMMYNQLVGAVRLRQQRVRNDSCVISKKVEQDWLIEDGSEGIQITRSFYFPAFNLGNGGSCFARYTKQVRASDTWGPCTPEGREALQGASGDINKFNTSCINSGFEWWSEAQTGSPSSLPFNDASGYVRDIEPDEPPPGQDTPRLPAERMAATIDELQNFLWLDEQTRAFYVTFSIYNANFNLYAWCNFCFEFSAGGVIRPTFQFKVMKIDLYENILTQADLFKSTQFMLDVATNIMVLRLLLLEIARYAYIRWTYGSSIPYITNIWNMLELANITPFFFAWAVRLTFSNDPNRVTYAIGLFATRYAEIGTAAETYSLGFGFDSISILVSFIKFFKYMRLHPAFALLYNVIAGAGKDMAYFFFMLLLFLVGFVMFAEQLFGPNIVLFSNTLESMTTLLKMIFGVVDIYWDMVRAQSPGIEQIVTMLFFTGYVIWMFFILVNVFLAILNDAYGGARGEMDEQMEQKRIALEERKLAGVVEEAGVKQKVAALRRAARGRLNRFGSRIAKMARQRKRKPMTSTDAVMASHIEADHERYEAASKYVQGKVGLGRKAKTD